MSKFILSSMNLLHHLWVGSTPPNPADLQTVDLQLADVLLRGQSRADADQLTSGPEADDGVRDGVLQRG